MGNRIQALAQQLTGKASLDESNVEEVKHIARRFPYFAPAQFLLLQKLKQLGESEEAAKQQGKAILYYHNPLLFDYYIQSDTTFHAQQIELTDHSIDAPVVTNDEMIEETPVYPTNDQSLGNVLVEEAAVMTSPMPSKIEEDEPQLPEVPMTMTDGKEEPTVSEPVAAAPEEEAVTNELLPVIINNEQPAAEEMTSSTQSPVENKSGEKSSEEPLAFEPFHTVDYFASQGIKISHDELPKDKLGKQLKSFTEWLKTMKRLPSTQLSPATESSAEKKVETMADHSVSESNVVTEAMAEVWQKQGKTEKALDIYNKLSLLNPSKKAYFAAKIENLKQS